MYLCNVRWRFNDKTSALRILNLHFCTLLYVIIFFFGQKTLTYFLHSFFLYLFLFENKFTFANKT